MSIVACTACHDTTIFDGIPTGAEVAHTGTILAMTNTGPGQTPVMTFRALENGLPRNLIAAPMTSMTATAAGPNTDFAAYASPTPTSPRFAPDSPTFAFAVTDTLPLPRRQIVADAKCDGCHEYTLNFHDLTFEEALPKMVIPKPFPNSTCVRCHSTRNPLWLAVGEHASTLARTRAGTRAGTLSCASVGCHGPPHPFKTYGAPAGAH